ncbi:MAG TPA: DUF4856 domain-containing protein [Niastella sp.]
MNTRSILTSALLGLLLASCDKDDDSIVKPYTVPTTYTFSNVNFSASANRNKMAEELRAYLGTSQSGSAITTLDATKINNMWSNTNNPFANTTLNTTGFNIKDFSGSATLIKGYIDSISMYNTSTVATQGNGGYLTRGNNKIIIGPRGLEYVQGYAKGIMSTLFFKEAVRLLTEVKTVSATDTTKAQALWDEAFGNLAVPYNYDTTVAYTSSNPDRPVMWGGYLWERGKPIQAGGIIFSAFLKGRAAIGGYDKAVRDEQADIIIAKWEQLAARAALVYANMPTLSANAGNLASQFHALSEGYGFLLALQYRPANSKLTAANYETLKSIINKDFYVLINQPGFTDLVTAQNILKTAYNIEP